MTKKIAMNDSVAGYTQQGEFFSYRPEEIVEVDEFLANAWIASGTARLVSNTKSTKDSKTEFATAPKAETADLKK